MGLLIVACIALVPTARGWSAGSRLPVARCPPAAAVRCVSPAAIEDEIPQAAPKPAAAAAAPAPAVVAADADAPAPAAADGTSLPPESFESLLQTAAEATDLALADGNLLLEVEFPPLPVSQLDDSAISAYDVLAANLQFAVEYIKRLERPGGSVPRKVALTLPDGAERRRAAQFYGDEEPWTGVKLWSLNGGGEEGDGDGGMSDPMKLFGSLFKQGSGEVAPAPWADMHIIVGASAQELPAIRRLAELEPTKPIVCFNLKLDTLRGDLGLPAFPGKDVHEKFLCKVKPVYYLRPRAYSLSLSVPPFIIAYSGVLFRKYPEGYQTLLDKGKGKYRRVNVEALRPALGGFKSQLTTALKLEDGQASKSAISQAGFKQSTWWEDDADGRDISLEWRK